MWLRIGPLIVKELLTAFRDPERVLSSWCRRSWRCSSSPMRRRRRSRTCPSASSTRTGGLAASVISRFERLGLFDDTYFKSEKEIQPAIDTRACWLVVHIPQDFSRKVAGARARLRAGASRRPEIQQRANPQQLHQQHRGELRRGCRPGEDHRDVSMIVDRSWFNPNREYRNTMVPGLVGTLTMTTVLM